MQPRQNEASVAFTRQGVLVTSAQQGRTLLWDAGTGRIERHFPIGGPFAVSSDGHRLAVAQNNANPFDQKASLAVLDLRTGAHRSLQAPPSSAGWLISVEFTPDGASVVGRAVDAALRVWDVASGSIAQTFTGQGSGLNVVSFPPTARPLFPQRATAAWRCGACWPPASGPDIPLETAGPGVCGDALLRHRLAQGRSWQRA